MRELSNEVDTDPTNDQQMLVSGKFGLKNYPNLRDNYCLEGYYCTYGATSMTECPIGTVNRLRGRTTQLDCLKVDAGFYVDIPG